ncbi:MAG: outer membrane beta-barrel protein [Holosporaceae bacterium]
MKTLKVLGIAGLCLTSVASVAKADPTQFTGFQVGGLLGMSGMHIKDASGDTNGYGSKSGGSLGLYLGYGMVFSGFFVGIDGNYTMPFVELKTPAGKAKYKSSGDLALRFGMDLNKVALPYLRLGYAMNKVESDTFSGFTYGVGIDTKLAPQMVLGFEFMQTADCETKGIKMNFNTARIKVAFHL